MSKPLSDMNIQDQNERAQSVGIDDIVADEPILSGKSINLP